MRKLILALSLVPLASFANAALTTTGPFSGDISEGFEGFTNYLQGGFHSPPNGSSIFGGAATLGGSSNLVYQPGVANVNLGGNGNATVQGGVNGLTSYGGPMLFTFNSDIFSFGGYFNAYQQASNINFTFYDDGNNVIGSTQTLSLSGTGLFWEGWDSTTGIKSVSIGGVNQVMDNLQARSFAPTPEPFTMSLGIAGVGLFIRRRQKAKKSVV